jgi:hypothetical protein
MQNNEINGVPRYINTSDKNKIENPYYKGVSDKFFGNANSYKFGSQQTNYEELSKILAEHGIYFDQIYSSTINREVKDSIQHGITFIATTTNPNVFWYKYEGFAQGSGQNYMIIYGKKMKTTSFLKLSKNKIIELILKD